MNVLLGIDGGEGADLALERVVQRALEAGDDLTVALVDDPEVGASPAAVERHVREVLEEAGLAGVAVRRLDGEPGPALVSVAEEEGFDRLALAGGTRSPMGKISLGPTVEHVLLNARVTVTLIR